MCTQSEKELMNSMKSKENSLHIDIENENARIIKSKVSSKARDHEINKFDINKHVNTALGEQNKSGAAPELTEDEI